MEYLNYIKRSKCSFITADPSNKESKSNAILVAIINK